MKHMSKHSSVYNAYQLDIGAEARFRISSECSDHSSEEDV